MGSCQAKRRDRTRHTGRTGKDQSGKMRYPAWIIPVILVILGLLAHAAPASAASCGDGSPEAEGIVYFASDIVVQPDSTTIIRETIRLVARGQQIRRGIERDLPGRYEDARGHVYTPAIRVLDVRRDGNPEPYTALPTREGTHIAIGAPNAVLPPGEYTYTLAYQVAGNLAFFPDRDSLYWPVTGSEWTVPLDCVTATVQLPPNVPPIGIHTSGWVGPEIQPSQQYRGTIDRAGTVTYVVDGPLGVGRGLTLSVDWPRGFVREPLALGQSLPLISAGQSTRILIIALVLGAAYGAFAGWWVHRRPRRPPKTPVTEPPRGLSPSVLRYLATGRHDERTLVAAVLDLAVKGFLIIRERETAVATPASPATSGPGLTPTYELVRIDHPSTRLRITPEEGAVLAELFGLRASVCPIVPASYPELRRASSELKRLVDAIYESTFFTTHARYLLPALTIALVALGGAALAEANRASLSFDTTAIWFVVGLCVTFGTAFILGTVLLSVGYTGTRQWARFGILCFALNLLPLGIALIILTLLARTPPLGVVLLDALGVGLAVLRRLLLTPTLDAWMLRYRLENFKDFLARAVSDAGGATAQDEWRDDWDVYLPYAVALDVDEGWSVPLARTIAPTGAKAAGEGSAVSWYQAGPRGSAVAAAPLAEALCEAVKEALQAPRKNRATASDRDQRLLGTG